MPYIKRLNITDMEGKYIDRQGRVIWVSYDEVNIDDVRECAADVLIIQDRWEDDFYCDERELRSDDYDTTWNDVITRIQDGGGIVLPVYKYEHGDVYYSRESSCPWDSGFVGLQYVEGDVCRMEGWDRQQAVAYMDATLREFSHAMNGDVYKWETDMHEDDYEGCGGYVGWDAVGQIIEELGLVEA